MTINLATLFFTPQTGNGAAQAPLQGSLPVGGVLAAVPGANFMDMIFARLNGKGEQEEDKAVLTPQGEGKTGSNDIMAMLTAAVTGQSQAQTKEQHVKINNLLHRIAHEVSATVPAMNGEIPDSLSDDTDLAADWLTSILASLPRKDGEQARPQILEGVAGTGASAADTVEMPQSILDTLPEPVRQDFAAFLNHLLQGVPQESRPLILKISMPATPGKHLEFDPAAIAAAKAASEALAIDTTPVDGTPEPAQDVPAAVPALIATGLTPEGLTKFMEELASRLQQGESFVVGLVKILPPQSKREVIFLPRAMVLSNSGSAAKTTTAGSAASAMTPEELLQSLLAEDLPADDMPAVTDSNDAMPQTLAPKRDKVENQLLALLSLLTDAPQKAAANNSAPKPGFANNANGIPSGKDAENETNAAAPKTSTGSIMAQLNALLSGGEEAELAGAPPAESGFAKVLKVLEEAQSRPYGKNGEANGFDKAVNVVKSMSPVLSTFHTQHVPLVGMAFAAALSDQIFPDGYDWTQAAGASHPMTLNSPAMAASLIGQAPHAGNPHPATQMIAATITKAAASGENRNITVKLEPPELGRIEISMSFSKEKSVKTHMIVEKQETFMMMQRDAHILERALHDAGIDTDGGVSFELAQDGGTFADNGRGGERGASGGGSSDADGGTEETVIETKMDWYIDPHTGATRYDILT
jgi:flagellar hook-length control protein FliK